MKKLPNHIIKSIVNNNTSLGDHPALPPDEEDRFLIWALSEYYDKAFDGVDDFDEKEAENELGKLLVSCKKIEGKNKESIENLCNNFIINLFDIPEDTIDIKISLTDKVDTSNQRLIPDNTSDFTFDSIDDMEALTDEIYKRRMLNCLICGASLYYSNNISSYVQELFKINSELPSMYSKILSLNNILLFNKKDNLNGNNHYTDAGKVDVYIQSYDNKVTIESEAILLPVLIEETIKGLLELAISHGLPKNREKAEYVIKKSDFKLAELWDVRIGCALWDIICNSLNKININIDKVGVNFFFMQLSMLEPFKFNKSLMEIFKGTKESLNILGNICDEILQKKDKDDFDEFIRTKNCDNISINDQYFNSDELSDEYFSSNELISDSI